MRDLHHDRADLDILHPGSVVALDQVLDPAPVLGRVVELLDPVPEIERHLRRFPTPALADRDHEPQEIAPHVVRNPAHHAQVDERDAPVVGQEDVARMGIGVKAAVHEDLLQVRLEQLVREPIAVHLEPRHRGYVRDLAAAHELHRQDALGRVVVDRLRDHQQLVLRQLPGELLEVRGFGAVIQLAGERAAELPDHPLQVIAPAPFGVLVEERGHAAERLEVFADAIADTGPLHLDRHQPAIPERGGVDLAERGGGQRLGVEGQERLADPHPELLLHRPLDDLEGQRLDPVLEAREGL